MHIDIPTVVGSKQSKCKCNVSRRVQFPGHYLTMSYLTLLNHIVHVLYTLNYILVLLHATTSTYYERVAHCMKNISKAALFKFPE